MLRGSRLRLAGKELTFDAVVIGGGAAGCTLASRIARENMSTLVLEAGPDVTRQPKWHRGIAAARHVHRLRKTGYEAMYDTTPQQQMLSGDSSAEAERRPMVIPAPSVLGGAGIMGGRTWIIGDAADWDGFLDYESALRPRIKSLEQIDTQGVVVPQFRGKIGRWTLSRSLVHSPYYKPFSNMVMEEFKLPLRPSFNFGESRMVDGVARAEVNFHPALQQNQTTLDLLLETVTLRRPLSVSCRAEAAEITFAGGVADGVRTADGTVIKAGMVVVAAGALGTPQLLLGSTGAPAQACEGVGEGLWDVPQVVLQYATKDGLSHHSYVDPLVQLLTLMEWQRSRVSAASSSYDDMVALWSSQTEASSKGAGLIDVRLMVQPFLMTNEGLEGGRHGFQILVQLIRPRSRGTVTARTVDPNYLADPQDRETLARAVEKVKAGVLKSMRHMIDGDGPCAELFESASLAGGTCRAGTAVDRDSFLLRGCSNVYVCDSSVLPRPLGGDYVPNLAVLAEHAAERILNTSGRSKGVHPKFGKIA